MKLWEHFGHFWLLHKLVGIFLLSALCLELEQAQQQLKNIEASNHKTDIVC